MKYTIKFKHITREINHINAFSLIKICCILFILFGLVLSGCSSLRGFPDRPEMVCDKLKSLQNKFFLPSVDVLNIYSQKNSEETKRDYRDQVVFGRLLALDMQYSVFKEAIYEEGITSNLIHDISGVAVGAAGAVVTASDASRILSALSGGISGSRTSINKNLYYERTMPALLAIMDAERKTVRADIMEGLTQDTTVYPLGRALVDLERYLQAGSIPGAINAMTSNAGETEAKAQKNLEKVRTKSFVNPDAQRRIASLLESVDQLPKGKAWDILRNPPSELDEFVKSAVKARLGGTEMANAAGLLSGNENDEKAKAILKMVIVLMSDRSPENVTKWQAAIEAQK